jgi:hypothetical protein
MRFVILAALFVFCATPAFAVVPAQENSVAVLRALDKVTAHVEELEVPIDKPLKFGRLLIAVHTCRTTPPEEAPESAAYLEVSEFKAADKGTPVFTGWMFASSPALSALEHPVYDIWLIGCKSPVTR